jgi:ABC-type antimicrobial peptide transport system permease subunit
LTLIGAFASAALLLAMIGLYGVMSYAVARRTREIGVRMALGAGRESVLKLVLGQALKTAVFGVVAGLAGALVITRLMRSLLFEVSPSDPLTLCGGRLPARHRGADGGVCARTAGHQGGSDRRPATRIDWMSFRVAKCRGQYP